MKYTIKAILFLVCVMSFQVVLAQRVDNTKKSAQVQYAKDPLGFVQGYLLNTEVQQTQLQNLPNYTTTSSKKKVEPAPNVKKEKGFTDNMLCWMQDKYASLLKVIPDQISNASLYSFIEDWYGVKYRMGGTSKKGVDCSAFVQHLYSQVFGLNILRTACLQYQSTNSVLIKDLEDLKEGDLVFFKINTSRISHVGVYLKNSFFVHSASSKGVSIASLSSSYWKKYFAGAKRIIE
ncbi:MAG: C40 family peptidase [Chitinophagaceae bacterium]